MNTTTDPGAAGEGSTANVDGAAVDPGQGGGEGGAAGGADAGAGAEGSAGEGDAGASGDAGEGAAGGEAGGDAGKEPPAGAPESYAEFTVPEGMGLDPEATSTFSALAKEANLSQDAAQKLVDLASGLVQRQVQAVQDQAVERISQWADQVKADPVVGGPSYEANVQVALSAVSEFGDAELKQAFEEFGLGNHPAFVRAFYRIGKAMGEGGFVHGRGQEQPGKPVNPEQALAARLEAEQARYPVKKQHRE